jgi:hypothetical protein
VRYTILALAMLALLTVMALPAVAQSGGNYDDYGRGGYDRYDRGHDDDYDHGKYDDDYDHGKYDDDYDHGKYDDYDRGYDDYWWYWFFDEGSCGTYWSFWGPQYWCWSPWFGWIQLW